MVQHPFWTSLGKVLGELLAEKKKAERGNHQDLQNWDDCKRRAVVC